jgi:hypothetical protein
VQRQDRLPLSGGSYVADHYDAEKLTDLIVFHKPPASESADSGFAAFPIAAIFCQPAENPPIADSQLPAATNENEHATDVRVAALTLF